MKPRTYFGCSPETGATPTTWSAALATTHTGACLSNPAGSGVDLIVTSAEFTLGIAVAAVRFVGLASGFAAAGVTVHTTPGTVQTSKIGGGGVPAAAGLFDRACTLVGTPRWGWPMGFYSFFSSSVNSEAFPIFRRAFDPKDFEVRVPPGGWVAICTDIALAAGGWARIDWFEVEANR